MKKTLILLYLFLFIFMPPIFSFNILHILTIISLCILPFFGLKNIIEYAKKTKLLIFVVLMTISILYLGIVLYSTTQIYSYLFKYLFVLIELPICILFILLTFKKEKIDFQEFLNYIITVALIQAVLAIITFFVPQIKEIFVDVIANNAGGSGVVELAKVRIFGLSSYLTFSGPIVLTVVATICLQKIMKKEWNNIIPFFLISFSAIINARISIITLLIGFSIVFGLHFLNISNNIRKNICIWIFRILIIAIILIPFINIANNKTFKWIGSGFTDIASLFKGEKVGTFEYLFDKEFVGMPKTLKQTAFGTGISVYNGEKKRTDIGYINDLWLGGLMFMILLYTSILYLFVHKKKYDNIEKRIICISLIIIFLIVNIKGAIVSANEFINLLLLLIAYINYDYYNKKTISN
jgi:hypothetical protein